VERTGMSALRLWGSLSPGGGAFALKGGGYHLSQVTRGQKIEPDRLQPMQAFGLSYGEVLTPWARAFVMRQSHAALRGATDAPQDASTLGNDSSQPLYVVVPKGVKPL
jgi:hypothetical protein